jgi:hypothetical protein
MPILDSTAAEKYTRAVDHLLLGSYVSSALRLHDPAGRYTLPQVQRWLSALADGLAWQARHSGSATDIRLDQWWRPTARWATTLTLIILAAIVALSWLIQGAASDNPHFLANAGSYIPVFLVGFPFPPFRLRLRQIAKARGLVGLVAGLVAGLVFGLMAVLVIWLWPTPGVGYEYGPGLGLAIGLAIGLAVGFNDDSPEAVGPRDVIRANGQYGLTIALAAGLLFGVFISLLPAWASWYGFGFGFGVGLTGGLAVAANAWARYHVTVMIAAARRQGPLRFGVFLDWAQEAGLLRVSGVAYQFRHRQLQDWLTSRPMAADGTAAGENDT